MIRECKKVAGGNQGSFFSYLINIGFSFWLSNNMKVRKQNRKYDYGEA